MSGNGVVAIVEIIGKKRDGQELSEAEIAQAVSGFVSGAVSEGQMGALLMAIFLNGMTARESAALTMAMADSGKRLDLSQIPGIKVDKHSTGGVGDKTTLVVAPLVASLGVKVPKMSGRALGHTGGTIDKLETIPGLTTELSPERFCRQVAEVGVAIACQTADMAPADKKIYALRDATGTVESIPLIASSVMSKKLAAGADAIVLDVKAGRGAFMPDVERASELARSMVAIGRQAGKRMVGLVTRMEQPLGMAVGDALELVEAVETLAGRGPGDFVALCEIVAGHMLALGGAAREPEEGRGLARQALKAGAGVAKLREMVAAQGGEAEALEPPYTTLSGPFGYAQGGPTEAAPVMLEQRGFVVGIDARRIGFAVRALKSLLPEGKQRCGVLLERKVGDAVAGQPVAVVQGPRGAGEALATAAAEVAAAFAVGQERPVQEPLLAAVVTG
jgi:pyrimidine-nucleoside phosphorylase